MNLQLIKEIYDLHIKGFEGLEFIANRIERYDFIHSETIKDEYSNFISNFDVKNEDELKVIVDEASKKFESIDRQTVVYLIPYMQELYNNKEKYFKKENYELLSDEVWQIFTDFDRLNKIETDCNIDVRLEVVKDMKEYANTLVECYQSGDKDDPYGNLDDGYKQSFNYKKKYDEVENEFYFIKVNDKIIGTTESVYDDKLYGIYSLAIKSEYRKKGIGKEILKKQLQMCKDKNMNIAFLQTEQGFYPAKLYRKIGFKDLCEVYYYKKISL